MATLRPSTKPISPSPRRNPTIGGAHSAADVPYRLPTTGIAGCCTRAASGQPAAALPRRLMNSRRFMMDPPLSIILGAENPHRRLPYRSNAKSGLARVTDTFAYVALTTRARGPSVLEHDPEKWKPVFGKDHAPTKR